MYFELLLVVVFDFFELGVDGIVCSLGLSIFLPASLLGLIRVHLLGQLGRDFSQLLGLGFDIVFVSTLQGLFEVLDGSLDRLFLAVADLVGSIRQGLTHGVNHGVTLVAGLYQLFELAVFLGVGLGIAHHLLDFFIVQAGRGLDHDGLFLAGGLVFGRHVQDTVGIDVEGHFDLRHTARCRRNVGQVETTQGLVLCRLLALTLNYVDGHRSLVVVRRGERLRLLGRDGGVLVDQRSRHATHGLDTQGQRGYVQQQYVFYVTRQNCALNGSTHGHGFVRVYVFTGLFAEEFLNLFLHQRHAGLTTNQDNLVDFRRFQAGILQSHFAGLEAALNQLFYQGLQLGTGQLYVHVLGAGCVCGDVRQVHICLLAAGQFDLGLLASFFQTLHRQGVAAQVDAAVFLELVRQVFDDLHVEVFATQEGVAVGGQNFELMLAVHIRDFNDGQVEGTTTQIVNSYRTVAALLVQAIGQGSGSRLVDDPLHFQTGDLARVFSRLALAVVEVDGNGDHRFRYLLAQVVFCSFLHFLQNFCRDLGRCHLLAFDLNPSIAIIRFGNLIRHHLDVFLNHVIFKTTTDQTLDGVQGVMGVGNRLALGRLTNQGLAVICVGNDGRRGAVALCVFNDLHLVAIHDGYTGVGGSQVDTNNLAHRITPILSECCPGELSAPAVAV